MATFATKFLIKLQKIKIKVNKKNKMQNNGLKLQVPTSSKNIY